MKPFHIPQAHRFAPANPNRSLPPSLWHALTPSQRQQVAQALAELIQRMRREPPATPTVNDHEHA